MRDPDRQAMLETLRAVDPSADDFDMEEAIYWYASDYHGGQWSNLYSALSMSPYSPGAIQTKPSETSYYLYQELQREFGH